MDLDLTFKDTEGSLFLDCMGEWKDKEHKEKAKSDLVLTFEEKLAKAGLVYNDFDVVMDIAKSDDKRLAVISCAGSGKTVNLLLRLARQLDQGVINPTKTVVCSFLASDADRLENKFARLCKSLKIPESKYGAIRFGTLHSLFLEVIRTAGINWKVLTTQQRKEYIRQSAGKIVKSTEDLNNLDNLYSYVDNRLSDIYKYTVSNRSNLDLDASPEQIAMAYTKFKELKARDNVMDFDDMQTFLYQALTSEKGSGLRDYCSKLYENFYIDEVQDVSTIQYEIIKYFWNGNNKNIFIIGDDDQSIYSWRGGDVSIFTKRMPEDYQFTFKNLSVNYRCGSNIIEFIKPSICVNANRYPKDIHSHEKRGEVIILHKQVESDMKLADKTWDAIKVMGGMSADSAILVRETKHAIPIAVKLVTEGVNFKLGNEMMTLKNNKVMRNVLDLVRLTRGTKPVTECSAVIKTILGAKGVREFISICERLPDIDIMDIKFSAPKLLPYWEICNRYIDSNKDETDIKAFLRELGDLYATDISMYNTKIGRIILSFFDVLLYIFDKYVDSSVKTLDHLFFAIDEIENIMVMSQSNKTGIEIKTIHSAKGRGWDDVLIFNDSLGYIPSHEDCDIEEERRLHYVAVTRAKNRCFIATKLFSEFLYECDIKKATYYRLDDELTWQELNLRRNR